MDFSRGQYLPPEIDGHGESILLSEGNIQHFFFSPKIVDMQC